MAKKIFLVSAAAVIALAIGCSSLPNLGSTSAIEQTLLSTDLVSAVINGPDRVTTSFADATPDTSLSATFGDDTTPAALDKQPRNSSGAYLLAPGFYEMSCRSYCLHAGTQGPSQGGGYLYAAMKGTGTDVITALIRNSESKPDISQGTVQLLIWAVLAKSKFTDLPTNLQVAAAELLSPDQLFELNGGAVALIPDDVIQKAVASLPQGVQQVLAAENSLRQLFAQASVSYQDAERLAVLPADPAAQTYPEGGWSQHPGGYFVRYYPSGYQTTRVQVYVPPVQGMSYQWNAPHPMAQFAGLTTSTPLTAFDAIGDIAVAANTLMQRLAQSNASSGSGTPPPSNTPPTPLPTPVPTSPPTPTPTPTPAFSLELRLLNGATADFDANVPTTITNPDLSGDDTDDQINLITNDDQDVLGVDPFPRGRPGQAVYCYSLIVIGQVTCTPKASAPPPAQISVKWNRLLQERLVVIALAADKKSWNVRSVSAQLNQPNGFPTAIVDMNLGPNQGFNLNVSPKYRIYSNDNPGAFPGWLTSQSPAICHVGDYLLLENLFNYTATVSSSGLSDAQQTLMVGQKLVLQRVNGWSVSSGGVSSSGVKPIMNVVSTSDLPDAQMPDDAAHIAIIRSIVGGTLPITIDPHANDPYP